MEDGSRLACPVVVVLLSFLVFVEFGVIFLVFAEFGVSFFFDVAKEIKELRIIISIHLNSPGYFQIIVPSVDFL